MPVAAGNVTAYFTFDAVENVGGPLHAYATGYSEILSNRNMHCHLAFYDCHLLFLLPWIRNYHALNCETIRPSFHLYLEHAVRGLEPAQTPLLRRLAARALFT